MIRYKFMRAQVKGSEGSEKMGGGCEKKGGAPHPPFFKKHRNPPVYAAGANYYY